MTHQVLAKNESTARSGLPRASVSLLCEIRQGTRPWSLVRLEDISQQGFRVSCSPSCIPDRPLRLRMPGLQILNTKICWHRDKTLGCEFAQPLHIAVFENIVGKAAIGN